MLLANRRRLGRVLHIIDAEGMAEKFLVSNQN
jgi:hypothetical protein